MFYLFWVLCHVEVSALAWSLIQSRPTKCGLSYKCDHEAPSGEAKVQNRTEAPRENIYTYIYVISIIFLSYSIYGSMLIHLPFLSF
jgi:hypothetical protein